MSKRIEIEYKFELNDKDLKKLLSKGMIVSCDFIIDKIYGKKGVKEKIRVRENPRYSGKEIEKVGWIKKGTKSEEDLKKLPKGWKLENSYNKIRCEYLGLFDAIACNILIDFYTIGAFLEIEGEIEEDVARVSKELGFNPKDRIKEGIDEIFCNKMKKRGIKPPLHWGFGKDEDEKKRSSIL
jgi:hypothetical protein